VGTDSDYIRYHDTEWGVPLVGDQKLFEKLSLEAFQAGLSWITIRKDVLVFETHSQVLILILLPHSQRPISTG
jgi:3-methyladenine DNA glycosylase Tag